MAVPWERLGMILTVASVVSIAGLICCMLILSFVYVTASYILLSIVESCYYGFFGFLIGMTLLQAEWHKANFGFICSNVGRGFFVGLIAIFAARNGGREGFYEYRWAFFGISLLIAGIGVGLVTCGVKMGETRGMTKEKFLEQDGAQNTSGD